MRAPQRSVRRLFTGYRQQRFPVLLRIVERIESADQEVAHPKVVVVEQRVGNLFWRAHQRGGVVTAADQLGDPSPQALIHHLALRRRRPQALRADAIGLGFETAFSLRRAFGGDVQNMLGFSRASASVSAIIGRKETLKPISR